jgi:hypothetical protein
MIVPNILLIGMLLDPSVHSSIFALPLRLLAFSKGSLVLNHFIAEFATALALQKELNPPLTILDWEDENMAVHVPAYEPTMRIGKQVLFLDIFKSLNL